PWQHLLSYVEAILRVYNLHGRRDNIFKARIKILVRALGAAEFARQVDEEWSHLADGTATITAAERDRVAAFFVDPDFPAYAPHPDDALRPEETAAFARWQERAVVAQRHDGRYAVTLSLKKTGVAPGDATARQMDDAADLAERFGTGEIRVAHDQNLVLPHVAEGALARLWRAARATGLATPNLGLLTDIIACPGGDFCSLANAKSIPIAEAIQQRFDDLDYLHDIGELDLNISGCMNSCGHHHAGHIGILGVDKDGAEWYQVSIGGANGNRLTGGRAAIGKVIGPSFAAHQLPDVVSGLIDTYLERRSADERFIDTVERIGMEPFKHRVYGASRRSRHEELTDA
ncbi:MAG TPA: nitrite/sulfite reductase, partial [Burkholderiaceae bacterium]|nr:nitrite/sulfite reductase [Burkholderiaceae bacterium]